MTLFRKPADQEDGRLMSENSHLVGVWMSVYFIDLRSCRSEDPALEAQSLSQRITRDVAGGYFAMPSCFIHV